mmetsp:Transcript_6847/g.14118  ORF Transcript_6847/g.14118 Transcript_6847/m.14118 type:complete len:263 (+) Transcript_6847:2-790(+)
MRDATRSRSDPRVGSSTTSSGPRSRRGYSTAMAMICRRCPPFSLASATTGQPPGLSQGAVRLLRRVLFRSRRRRGAWHRSPRAAAVRTTATSRLTVARGSRVSASPMRVSASTTSRPTVKTMATATWRLSTYSTPRWRRGRSPMELPTATSSEFRSALRTTPWPDSRARSSARFRLPGCWSVRGDQGRRYMTTHTRWRGTCCWTAPSCGCAYRLMSTQFFCCWAQGRNAAEGAAVTRTVRRRVKLESSRTKRMKRRALIWRR